MKTRAERRRYPRSVRVWSGRLLAGGMAAGEYAFAGLDRRYGCRIVRSERFYEMNPNAIGRHLEPLGAFHRLGFDFSDLLGGRTLRDLDTTHRVSAWRDGPL